MIADADADTRALYRQVLESYGYTVAEAADGPSALVAALSEPVDLVVTDARLPIFDGYALCGVLRDDRATRVVPVMVITSESNLTAPAEAHRAGATLVLEKPVPLDRLVNDVARLIENGTHEAVSEISPPGGPDGPTAVTGSRKKSWARRHCVTTTPPTPPPALRCRLCDEPLVYQRSFVGGVNAGHPEQWDEYSCPSGCAAFEYRHRSKTIREQ